MSKRDLYIKAKRESDVTLEINGVSEGTFASGSTIEVNLTDGTNPVTPDDVTVVGNVVTVELPTAVANLATSLPIKSGQTVSFNDYDDGQFQFGRLVDPNTLDEPNVFGNLNRFTAIDGSQSFGSPVVFVDHSTQQKDGRIIWYTLGTVGALVSQLSFADTLDRAGKTDWRLAPITLYENLRNFGATRPFALTPFALTTDLLYYSATNNPSGGVMCFYNFAANSDFARVQVLSGGLSLRGILYRIGNISELI
jgi:hypothetical protein